MNKYVKSISRPVILIGIGMWISFLVYYGGPYVGIFCSNEQKFHFTYNHEFSKVEIVMLTNGLFRWQSKSDPRIHGTNVISYDFAYRDAIAQADDIARFATDPKTIDEPFFRVTGK